MTRRSWTLWFMFVAVFIAAAALKSIYGTTGDDLGDKFESISNLVAFGVFATVGAIITSRRPRHAIGWIYLLGAIGAAVGVLGSALIDMDRATLGSLPGRATIWFVGDLFSDFPLVALIALPLLLFPDGRLPSHRWRIPMAASIVSLALIAARSFVPGHFDHPPDVAPANPLGIPGAKSILESLSFDGVSVLALLALVSIGRLFWQFRGSSGAEREQLKWLGWGGFWTLFLVFMSGPGTFSGMFPETFVKLVLLPLIPFLFAIALSVIPLFTAVAILRYRLYDIDRIISRTFGYVLITGVLLGAYLGLVVLFQVVTRPITDGSDIAVAASTLVVAAAFRPVRRRVQRIIDHRFNRSRYDAAEAIDLFTTRLRDEVDIDTLSADLQTLIHHTMEPAHVSLWLRSRT